MGEQLVAQFTDAWDRTDGNDFASRMARRSLVASTQGEPALENALLELEKPTQEKLDLHITGAGVSGHSTSAEAVAKLYDAVSKAAKHIAKDLSGKARWSPQLLATAPAPGSLNITFEAPEVHRAQETIRGTEVATTEAQALRAIANVVAQAADDAAEEDSLLATTSRLPHGARTALKSLAETTSRVDWNIESKLEARGRESVHTRLTPEAARRLVDATGATVVDEQEIDMTGVGDGWIWSTATLRMIPDHGRQISISVPPALQLDVAGLVAQPDARLKVKLLKTAVRPPGGERAVSTTYSLRSVAPAPD